MIINQVATYRKAVGFTQAALAQEVGVSRRTIVSLEKGNYSPSLLLALQLAKTLKTDVNELFQLEEALE